MSQFNIWLNATRPKTLAASVAPVMIGGAMAYADGQFHQLAFFAALIGAILIQIGTNFANDYFDFIHGADTSSRIGPTRAVSAGLITPQKMKTAFIVVFSMAAVVGIYLVLRGGWLILLIGVLAIIFGIMYTASGKSLAYLGIADIFVLIFFGPVATAGTYFVQALIWHWPAALIGLSPGLISTALITINNLRDIEQDKIAHKNTLAVRFGKTFAQLEYTSTMLLAATVPLILYWRSPEHRNMLFASVILLFALPLVDKIWRYQDPRELNNVLGQTGKMLLYFAVVFSIGFTS